MANSDDILKDAREAFELAADAEAGNREAAQDDLRFARLAEQWPEKIKAQRERENRPCLTLNRMPSFIRQVVNDARQNKPSIKVHPVDDTADVETAEVLSGIIRNIEYTSNADVAYDTALESAVTGGFGYIRVDVDYTHDDTFDKDICIKRVADPFTIYGDPYSREADSSDWNSAFVVELLTKDAFAAKYKGADPVNWDALGYGQLQNPWMDDDRVMVAEWWSREEVAKTLYLLSDGSVADDARLNAKVQDGITQRDILEALGIRVVKERPSTGYKVMRRTLTGAEMIGEEEWAGRYIPIVPVYGDEVVVDGKRHFRSLVRDAKDPQRMFNYWRTTTTELVALAPRAPFIGRRGAFDTDADKWATANTQNHPYIEFDGPEAPQRQGFTGPPAGALQEALNAADDLKSIMGIYDASLGARSNETSGRAIMARQREGDVSTFHFIDNRNRAIRHLARVIIDLIPSVYSSERVQRIMGQDGKPQNVKVQPGANPKQPIPQPDGSFVKAFDLTVGKYDVAVEAGPSFTTQREEMVSTLTEMMRAFPQAAPLVGDLLVKNMDLPGSEEIADRLKAMLPPQVQGQNPQVQQLQKVIEQGKAALQGMQAKIGQLETDKSLEARKLDIQAFDAETNRLKVMGAGMQPEAVQALVMQTLQQVLASPDVLPLPAPQGMPMMPMGGPPEAAEGPEMHMGGPPMPPHPMPGPMMPQQPGPMMTPPAQPPL